MPPRPLSVVIASYNTRELLRRCLASLEVGRGDGGTGGGGDAGTRGRGDVGTGGWGDAEVLVVDNASSDGSADMVEAEFPGVRVLRAEGNLGFARATNLGLRESRGDLVLLLNPDAEVLGDALASLAAFLDGHPNAAMVGPALVYPDGRPQHAAFRFPTLWMSFLDFFPLNHRLANSRLNGRYRPPADGRPFPVDHLLGAAMMIRRAALEQVGLLDESFFMYCEEVDWCLRARRLGWEIYHLPSARVVHHGGRSTRQFREAMLVELHRSRYRLFRKHYPASFVHAHRAILRLGLAREAAAAWWAARRGRITVVELRSRLRAYRAIWSM